MFEKRIFLLRAATLGILLTMVSHASAFELTWEEAWRLAQKQNAAVRSAREDVIYAREQVNEARSGALPTLNLGGVYTRNLKTPVFFFEGQPIRIGLDNEYVAQLQLTQPIWVAGKVGTALRAARSYVKQSEAGVTQTLQDVRVQLAQTFYGAILARELVTTAQTALDRATAHRDQARLMYEQGVVSEYDKLRAEVQVANLEPPLLAARNQYELAKENLRRLVNLDPKADIEIVGSLDLSDISLPNAEIETALQQRPELQALEYSRKTQRQLMNLVRRDLYLPSFYAAANYQVMTQADNYDFNEYDWVKSSAVMLQMSLPLFDGFRTPARTAQYRAQLRRLDYLESDLRQGIRIDVDNSRRELERALRTVAVHEDNVQEAERAHQIANVRYENGLGTQLELLDSEFQLDRARVNHLNSLYEARIARMQLDRALGTPVSETTEP